MVKLSISSTKGNGARYFPHAGYLALTPIKVEGVVRTRLDDDRKPILSSDILVAVRCYEARIGRTGITHSNILVDYHVPLWTKPHNESWAELGDGEWPFRLVLSPKLTGHSTANFQEYRVFWRVEAVLNHIPMTGVGRRQIKTYDLPLMRYDAGEPLPPAPSVWCHVRRSKQTSLRYVINTPSYPLGPMDIVPVSLKLNPSDPATTVHSIALAVERRLEFNNPPFVLNTVRDDSSLSSTTVLVDHSQPHSPSPKTNTFLITSAEATDVRRDENGIFAKTVTLQVPTQKSSSHWAVGETMSTALVTLRFILRVKVTLATPHGTYETLELEERELRIVASNESQRRLAMSKYTEAMHRARTRDPSRLPSPPPSPTDEVLPTTPIPTGPLHAKGSAKGKSVRRPHTSAGPRDSAREVTRCTSRRAPPSVREPRPRANRGLASQTSLVASTEGETATDHVRAWEDELERIEVRSRSRTTQTPSGSASPTVRSVSSFKSYFGQTSSAASIPSPTSSVASSRHLAPPSPVPPPPPLPAPPESVQAWEEELERIAAQSRRRSVEMLGFTSERRTRPRIDSTAAPAA